MLEAKWEIDSEQGKGWIYTGNLPSLFASQKTNLLEEKLKKFMGIQSRFNGEIYEFTLKLGFLPKHTNEIFYNWQQAGNLEVLAEGNKKARRGAFYIAYNYYKNERQKVEFKLNN